MKVIIRWSIILITLILSGYILGCGTLGNFNNISFHTSKRNVVNAIDSIYSNYPQYIIPEKWKVQDDWKSRGYDFLDSRIFYFNTEPREMIYVTFVGETYDSIHHDTNYTNIAIRAVDKNLQGWKLRQDVSSNEADRIEERFYKEIISKLEKYTNTTAINEQ